MAFIDNLSFKMTKFQKYYQFLIKHTDTHTHRDTFPLFCLSLSLSCICRCVYYTIHFYGIRLSVIFSPMIMILLSACLLFSFFGKVFTNSLQRHLSIQSFTFTSFTSQEPLITGFTVLNFG